MKNIKKLVFYFFFIAIIHGFGEYEKENTITPVQGSEVHSSRLKTNRKTGCEKNTKSARRPTLNSEPDNLSDSEKNMNKAELIVALDRASARETGVILANLPAQIQWYKLGLELFIADGPSAIAMLHAKKKNIFLDLKLHDIPNTAARAVRAAAAHGVSLITVHALGGESMLKTAAEAAKTIRDRAPKVVAVTVLTSHSQDDLAAIGIRRKMSDQVLALAELALKCGVDGIVASVNEAPPLRKNFGKDFILVVPGIRPAGSETGDQKRFATPALAIEAGADFLVVGRPIIDAKDPSAAARAILAEMQNVELKERKPILNIP